MKLFVQVPCLNEEKTLPLVLESIPKEIPGIDSVEILIIDDGSTDATVEVAKSYGVKHFVRHARNQGLARSFRDGVEYALANGADIVVNTDGDNQYPQEAIPELVAPIVAGRADIVIADRQTSKIAHFSRFKKLMQNVGSRVVNRAAGTKLPDAASGFRAYSKGALYRLNVVTQFSYCMETIIQAGNKRLRIDSVPITTNPKTRESRLFSNIFQHMFKSGTAIVRSYLMFKPHVPLGWTAAITGILGAIPFIRFLIFYFMGQGAGHIQSLIFGSAMIVASIISITILIIADLLKTNRVLLEQQLEGIKALRSGPPRPLGAAASTDQAPNALDAPEMDDPDHPHGPAAAANGGAAR
ncbi:glycosyltransferase family 2 protein [Actinotignum sp. GS-2025f]|uniref:glycosyltransferase family 2 protein n=1 Tax=Actinotignum sp. GS-2025f TaxID=3427279 RepID=UPI003F467E5C